MRLLTLRFPDRCDEVLAFVRRHHYRRSAPSVYRTAFAWENDRGKLQAVNIVAEPPSPAVAPAFVRDAAYAPRLAYESRLVGAGISAADLDALLAHASAYLYEQGSYWTYTLCDSTSWVIDTLLNRILCRGFDGHVYDRNGYLFLGYSRASRVEAFVVDGRLLHARQGAKTLTLTNVRDLYPAARQIQLVGGTPKMRWARILAHTERERADRAMLMRYHPQPYIAAVQPRLLSVPGLPLLSNKTVRPETLA